MVACHIRVTIWVDLCQFCDVLMHKMCISIQRGFDVRMSHNGLQGLDIMEAIPNDLALIKSWGKTDDSEDYCVNPCFSGIGRVLRKTDLGCTPAVASLGRRGGW